MIGAFSFNSRSSSTLSSTFSGFALSVRLKMIAPASVSYTHLDVYKRQDMDIGKNIQAIRYKNNMTQDQVVAKLNLMGISITKSTYAKLETNRMKMCIRDRLQTMSFRL